MKKLITTLTLGLLGFGFIQEANAQATATQTVTLQVDAIYRISTSGNPGALVISSGTAGSDVLTAATDNSTSYSITQNVANTVKLTAHMDSALPAGYTLEMNLASTQGSSAGNVDVSNATSGSAVDLVTAINRGADANQVIGYTFSATATAGTLPSTTRTVTLTLTN